MTKSPAFRGLLAGLVLLAGGVTRTYAQAPTPDKMLDPKLAPKMDDVNITTPTPDEIKRCTVELVKGATAGSSAWLLKDPRGQPLRRFFDSKGGGKVDMWSYYKDGVETYREFDTTYKGSPNHFRWLNAGGMKYGVGGVDARGKGQITAWRMISAEEVAFEAYQAVAQKDFARLQILFVTEGDLQALKVPSARIKTTLAVQQTAQQKFTDLVKAANLAGAKFDGVETTLPQCDTTGDVETVKFASPVRYIGAKEERKWIHTGEILQVGMAWKLVGVPTDQDPDTGGSTVRKDPPQNAELQKLLEMLTDLDKNPPNYVPPGGKDPKTEKYLRERIAVVQRVIPLDKADQRESWYKQLFDNLMALAQNNCEEVSLTLLKSLADDVAKQMPGSNLAGYGAYRYYWSTYSVETSRAGTDTKKITEAQDRFITNLGDFVKKYSKAEDTAEALYQLGSGCEFGGKIEEAKRWYAQLVEGFPTHHLAPRSKGCVARLSLVGNRLELVAPMLHDQAKAFDVNQLKGKVVIVHYWSSQSENHDGDFNRLKRLLADVGSKQNVELVCVCLDDTLAKAKESVARTNAPGTHLYQAPSNNAGGGQNSTLATQYGIHILPTIFIVGRDGRVTNNALQIADIESELKKVQ